MSRGLDGLPSARQSSLMSTAGGVPGPAKPQRGPEDVWGRRAALAVALLGLVVVVVPTALHIGQVIS